MKYTRQHKTLAVLTAMSMIAMSPMAALADTPETITGTLTVKGNIDGGGHSGRCSIYHNNRYKYE